PNVAEANTHGASGMAQLSAHAVPCRASDDGSQPCAVAGAVAPVRRTATTVMAIASTTMAAASPNDTRTPGCPARAITPAANGPMAKPTSNTAPAVAAP